jgi:hypothetical protein
MSPEAAAARVEAAVATAMEATASGEERVNTDGIPGIFFLQSGECRLVWGHGGTTSEDQGLVGEGAQLTVRSMRNMHTTQCAPHNSQSASCAARTLCISHCAYHSVLTIYLSAGLAQASGYFR